MHLVSSNALLCPSQWGCDYHFKMGDAVLTHQDAGQSRPLSVPIPVATGDRGGEDRCDFHGPAHRDQGHRRQRCWPEAVCPGLLQAPGMGVASSRHCPARQHGDICVATSPFSCERQVGHDMGTGDCHLLREGIVLRATRPMTRAGVGQLDRG